MSDTRQLVHELIDQMPETQLPEVLSVIESMLDVDDEPLTEEDRRAVAASIEYFAKGGEGISFEQVVADCGLTMDQIRAASRAIK
jgi:hypothetical protein